MKFSKFNSIIFLTFHLSLFTFHFIHAQPDSRNGKTIPANGTLRVLLIFVEMDYDVHDSLDPTDPHIGYPGWNKGKLPEWRDDLFSYDTAHLQQGKLTRFYAESSFNNFIVLGDYYPQLITLRESEVKNVVDAGFHIKTIVEKLNASVELKTQHNLFIDDFDLWTFTGQGEKKITPSQDNPPKIDHVMFIFRNLRNLPDANGRAVPSSCGKIFGYDANSYSNFGAYSGMPFNICRHEFTHLFLGDNNFHVGGGERMGNGSYFMSIQCMWSVIGAANASLLSCNGWDRDRFDWKPKNKQFTISALNENDKEENSDIDSFPSTEKIFVLRDFVTSGDVVRIKLPVDSHEFHQYLWIENHQTSKNNASDFDHFQYEENSCRDKALPGLYMYVQVDRDEKTGKKIYGGNADYLHPISAEGAFDYVFDTLKIKNTCVNDVAYPVVTIKNEMQNPLTGSTTFEIPPLNIDGNDNLTYAETGMPVIEKTEDGYLMRLRNLGTRDVVFTKNTKPAISNFSNPATTNVITCQGSVPKRIAGSENIWIKYNSKTIYLNGLRIEITDEKSDGSIKIKVRFDDFNIEQSIRWCADSILVSAKCNDENHAMRIKNQSTLLLDQGLTPTRNNLPLIFNQNKIFASPTVFTLPANTQLIIEAGSKLKADNGSKIYLLPGSKITVEQNATLEIKNNSKLILQNAVIDLKKGAKLIIVGKDNLTKDELSKIIYLNSNQIKVK